MCFGDSWDIIKTVIVFDRKKHVPSRATAYALLCALVLLSWLSIRVLDTYYPPVRHERHFHRYREWLDLLSLTPAVSDERALKFANDFLDRYSSRNFAKYESLLSYRFQRHLAQLDRDGRRWFTEDIPRFLDQHRVYKMIRIGTTKHLLIGVYGDVIVGSTSDSHGHYDEVDAQRFVLHVTDECEQLRVEDVEGVITMY